jgi:hypothetical protein
MEIKIIDIPSTIPYNGYISAKELGFIEYAPVRFYSNSTLNIVHVKKEGKVLTVNKSYSSIVNSDKRILECSGDMVKCGLEDFVYDVEEKKPIFDCKTSAALYDFYTYPAFSDDLGSVLIVTHDGKLKKFYPKT